MAPASDRSTSAFQGFLVEAKQYWMSDIWGALKDDYRERSRGRSINSPEQVGELLRDSPTYWFYSWLERHMQRAGYSGRYGLEKMAAEKASPARPPKLREVPVPDYYSAVDTHQHPGNLVGAANAGLVYKASAQSTQPGATNRYGLHERFARFVGELGDFKRILELGCGFGKSACRSRSSFRKPKSRRSICPRRAWSSPRWKPPMFPTWPTTGRPAPYGYADGAFDLVTLDHGAARARHAGVARFLA